jgi:predicted phage terminase large subunit-like protein
MSLQSTAEVDLVRQIALPSRLGETLGQQIWGHEWRPFPFILEAEREIVEACLNQDTQDWFILNCPNQVGKTSWAALLIFWYIGMFPDKQVIFISYSDGYSTEYGRLVRDLFKAHGKRLFGVEVDPGNDSIGDWSLKGHPSGGMLSVGIGGQITGRQGHLVVIDDILRTMMDAASATIKDGHWKEWQGSIWGRRQPGCVYVVTATRLANDDLTGRLLEQTLHSRGKGIQWRALIYQGLCELPDDWEGDPEDYRDRLGRKVGEPLQTRFSKPTDTPESNWWTDARDALDNQPLFDCMVQQNPGRSESGMFPADQWKYAPRDEWPPIYAKARGWDLATTGGSGDYSVGALIGRATNGDIYIFGREREQLSSHDGIERVKMMHRTDGAHIPLVIEEEKGGGKNLVEFYRREIPGATVIGSPVTGTKEQRAKPYSTMQQGGHVWLPSDEADQEWVTQWVKEHSGMMGDGRRPRHDDQIDAASHAVNHLIEHGVVEIADPNQAGDVSLEMLEFLEELGLAY